MGWGGSTQHCLRQRVQPEYGAQTAVSSGDQYRAVARGARERHAVGLCPRPAAVRGCVAERCAHPWACRQGEQIWKSYSTIGVFLKDRWGPRLHTRLVWSLLWPEPLYHDIVAPAIVLCYKVEAGCCGRSAGRAWTDPHAASRHRPREARRSWVVEASAGGGAGARAARRATCRSHAEGPRAPTRTPARRVARGRRRYRGWHDPPLSDWCGTVEITLPSWYRHPEANSLLPK